MLAKREIPEKFKRWNKKWGAPFGRKPVKFIPKKSRYTSLLGNLCGPFCFQGNNTTRVFEFPWVYYSLIFKPGDKILEIGGGYSGLQFVLDKKACNVVNVDPGVNKRKMNKLNRIFSTGVDLKNCKISSTDFLKNHFDRIYSISTLEHCTKFDIKEMLFKAGNYLKPNGIFVITLDLFLNVHPFCSSKNNEFGTNISVREILEQSGMKLKWGQREELFGFPEFDKDKIMRNLHKYLIGSKYPSLVQAFILKKI